MKAEMKLEGLRRISETFGITLVFHETIPDDASIYSSVSLICEHVVDKILNARVEIPKKFATASLT